MEDMALETEKGSGEDMCSLTGGGKREILVEDMPSATKMATVEDVTQRSGSCGLRTGYEPHCPSA